MSSKPLLILAADGSDLTASSARGLAAVLNSVGMAATWATTTVGDMCSRMLVDINGALRKTKPDVVVAINHTRASLSPALDKIQRVFSWMQDEAVSIKPELSRLWNNHKCGDWILGFTEIAKVCGYDPARLTQCPLPQDPAVFQSGGSAEGPDFLFASHKGEDPAMYLSTEVFRAMPQLRAMLDERHTDELVATLRGAVAAGHRFNSFEDVYKLVAAKGGCLAALFDNFKDVPRFQILMYWHVADRVYRQEVLSWFLKAGGRLDVVGRGWAANPRFQANALPMEPRDQLARLYHRARWSLHINSMVGYHHRLVEILMSRGRPLVHGNEFKTAVEPFDRDRFIAAQARYVKGAFKGALAGKVYSNPADYTFLTNLQPYCQFFANDTDIQQFKGR